MSALGAGETGVRIGFQQGHNDAQMIRSDRRGTTVFGFEKTGVIDHMTVRIKIRARQSIVVSSDLLALSPDREGSIPFGDNLCIRGSPYLE